MGQLEHVPNQPILRKDSPCCPNRPPELLSSRRAGITKHYDGFTLDTVSFTVNEGEIVGFVGQNGAGKSTTIKALLGLINLNGGSSTVFGVPSSELSRPKHTVLKERIGVVFDTVLDARAPACG